MRERALELSEGRSVGPGEIARVAAEVGDDLARWAFTQWALRERAAAKFPQAAHMLFDRDGLEMATQAAAAAYHASLFDPAWHVADLTAGLGADLIALAHRCQKATGFELDSDRAELLRHNLAVNHVQAEVHTANSLDQDWQSFDAAFADPARRTQGRRLSSMDDYLPNPRAILEKGAHLKRIVLKLSPLLPDHTLAELGSEVQFLSYGRECLEALVISDGPPGFSAVHIESGASLPHCPSTETLMDPLPWILAGDPAAIRADALGNFNLPALGTARGWLTGPEPVESPWLRHYLTDWSGPWREKTVQAALKERRGRIEAVKTRGAALDPAAIQKRLRPEGERGMILMLYAVGPKIRAALAERKMSDSP